MGQTKKINITGIKRIIPELRQLLMCRQIPTLDAGVKIALDAFVYTLGAKQGYYYLFDDSQQDQLICRCHTLDDDTLAKLPFRLTMKHLNNVFDSLEKEKILDLDNNTPQKELKRFKHFFDIAPKDHSYLFIRSKSRQDMLGLLILDYGSNKTCSEISQKEELLDGFQVFTNVVIHQKITEESESLYQFERVLRDISKQMINLPPDRIDSQITSGLKSITEFFNVDRGVIFQRISEHLDINLTHVYARIGPKEVPEKKITGEDFPYLIHQHFVKRRITCWNSIDELPKKAKKDRQSLLKWGTKSILSIPLVTGKVAYGSLNFSTLTKEIQWPKDIIRRAKVIGEIFSNTLARKYADEALQKSFKEIKSLKDQLESENTYLQTEIKLNHNFEDIIGDTRALKTVLLKITQCAPTDAAVIILGETGTGKELVARAVHHQSRRNKRPLIKVDCGSLPPTMIERELFGHEKGAFTGAHQQQKGRFEIADGGTLFLDEIGELPLELQSKLLRVLQDGEFERLGDPKTRKVDVRIISATNRELEEEIKKGNFRSDLWYRLNVFPIHIPPLRERPEDIPKLVSWFVNKHAKKMGKQIKKIPEDVLAGLSNRLWAGNVRELENTIQRAVIISPKDTLELSDPLTFAPEAKETPFASKTLESVEREHIKAVLDETNGRIYGPKGAAIILGLNPSTLRFRIKKLGIQKSEK